MRKMEKRLTIPSIFLTIILFGIAIAGCVLAVQFYQVGIINLFWIIVGITAAVGCLSCGVYVTKRLLKTRILKETFFFAFFVVSLSFLSHIVLNLVLKTNFSLQLIVTFWVIVGTPISGLVTGYSERTIWRRLRRSSLNRGVTLVAILLLVLIPIIEILPSIVAIQNTAYVTSLGMFEDGNDIARVQGKITKSVFTAEVPIPSDIVFEAKQMVNVTNRSNAHLRLNVYLEDLSGNLSKIRRLEIFFTLENRSECFFLTVNNGNVKYEEIGLTMKGQETITVGVISSAENVSSTDTTVMSLLMEYAHNNLSLNISITKADD